MIFRTLKAEEIDVRVGNVAKNGYTLLLYKDARCDMNILDETTEYWQRDHKEIKGNLYCGVGIFSEKIGQWLWKWDCGIESREDKEGNQKKGEASDSFKRACVNWGIGRELYTSPFIFISCETKYDETKKVYKIASVDEQKRTQYMRVKEIAYNDKREIIKLVIVDSKGAQVYPNNIYSKSPKIEQENMAVKKQEQFQQLKCECAECCAKITEKVALYSMKNYGKELCYNCQKSYIKEVEI